MKNIAIIGGGVAGMTAAVYALRANAQVTLFEQFGLGGLVATIDKIENFPSYTDVEGWKLAQDIAQQAKKYGLNVVRKKVVALTCCDGGFAIDTGADKFVFPAVVVATGTSHNKLGFENDYIGRGVSYCATCDGNFYKGRPVMVVGDGGIAVSEALYLADLCQRVYVAVSGGEFRAEDKAVSDLLSRDNVTVLYNAQVTDIIGQDSVSGAQIYRDGVLDVIAVDGIFVATGSRPATDFIQIDGIKRQNGYLSVDARCQTSVKGLFAAGDVTDGTLKQIVTACADGAKAGSFAAAYSAVVSKQ